MLTGDCVTTAAEATLACAIHFAQNVIRLRRQALREYSAAKSAVTDEVTAAG